MPATEIIEGRNAVVEALRAGRPINKILLSKDIQSHSVIAEIVYRARLEGVPFEYVDKIVIYRQSPTGAHQGVIALTSPKEYLSLDELIAIPEQKNEPPLFLVLDGIEDPQNLGAILRTADATGVHGVILRTRRATGLTPVVSKTSAGAVEYVPVSRVANIAQALEELKKANIWVTGIDMRAEQQYTQVDYKPPSAIVIGSEGTGLSPLVRKKCDFVAFIPMKGKVSSLNASVAAAVVLYEVLKQRG